MKTVKDVMAEDVVTADHGMHVATAAELMLEEGIGCLVVMKESKIAGIVTDRDLLVCAAERHNMQECSIANHMSSPVVTVPPDTLLLDLAKVMAARQIKRVPITEDGELVGIASFSDIADDMDGQVADMWSEWLELIAMTKTSALHRRGRRTDRQIQSRVKVPEHIHP